jgi:hypothetical protein
MSSIYIYDISSLRVNNVNLEVSDLISSFDIVFFTSIPMDDCAGGY